MKYDVLGAYRDYLKASFRPETARTYYIRLDQLLEGQNSPNIVKSLDISKVIERLSNITHKNYFSQSKNAFLHFCKFTNIALTNEVLEKIKQLEIRTHKKYRKHHTIDYKATIRSISKLRNEKLRTSYETMLFTGLRVFELCQIKAKDCMVTDTAIVFNFVGKGGHSEQVPLINETCPKLFKILSHKIATSDPESRLFYSSGYLQKQAKELGFECHDLRRLFAIMEYKKCRSKTIIQKKLRHSSIKNTNRYLKSRVKF